VGADALAEGLAGDQRLSADELVEDDAERVQVAARVDGAAAGLLG
jgi:hypothetical protein